MTDLERLNDINQRVWEQGFTSGKWIDEPESYLEELCQLQDRGTESEVFFDVHHHLVYKLISLKHYNILRLALDRIIIHNALFP